MKVYLKHILHITVFLIIFVVILLGLSRLVVPKNGLNAADTDIDQNNGIIGEKENTIDVLFLGDSEAYSAFVPMLLWEQYGITSYCCGTSAQTLDNTESYLMTCLERQTPEYVILETDTIFREASFDASFLQKANMVFPVFLYHDRWKSICNNIFTQKNKNELKDYAKGYKYTDAVNPASVKGYMKADKTVKEVSALNKNYISNINEKCKSKGAKLILVSTPSTQNWDMAKHNGITQLADELKLEYIDMNLLQKEIPINWEKDTRDKGDHLNYAGASKVTRYLGELFSKNERMADHRSDPDYESWNRSLAEFKKQF